ncbi:MAG TPA: PfkB family carbohydrate kinase, partial [Acidimicrobiales bacterium]|nr:PfkB family carbohydrate kinase [Acidimicrobiales bacterium]
MPADIAVVGHVGRDIVVRVDQLPPPGVGVPVPERLEMLGGKGANQAVALAQLGHHPALIGAVAGDPVG